MAYPSTLGGTTMRVVDMEESYSLVKGFPFTGVIADYRPNMFVKLNTDGTVSPIAALTDRVLGRITSTWNGTDNTVRVVVPFESIIRVKADGTLDEGDPVATSGYDTTNDVPIFKKAVTTNWVTGICLIGGATTTLQNIVGILRVPYLI